MYDIGFIEKYGSGIYMMKELCRKWENEEPRYELYPVETKIIFESQIKESTVIELEGKILEGINKRQKKAVEHVRKKGIIKREEYIKINKVSHTTASNELRDLVEKSIFKKTGKGKYLRYELTQG